MPFEEYKKGEKHNKSGEKQMLPGWHRVSDQRDEVEQCLDEEWICGRRRWKDRPLRDPHSSAHPRRSSRERSALLSISSS